VKVEIYGLKLKEDVKPGFNLAKAIVQAAEDIGGLKDGDVVVVTSKVVSKAEGRLVDLSTVKPSPFALRLSKLLDKPPEVVELILNESSSIVRMGRGTIVVEDLRGIINANAGVDVSNAPPGHAALLPLDPDASAKRLREEISRLTGRNVAVVISDTQGRPLRRGQVDVAIGCSGINPLRDRRGERDLYGYVLKIKEIAIADEIASAAELVIGQADEATPIAVIRGVRFEEGEGAKQLIRPREEDLFR